MTQPTLPPIIENRYRPPRDPFALEVLDFVCQWRTFRHLIAAGSKQDAEKLCRVLLAMQHPTRLLSAGPNNADTIAWIGDWERPTTPEPFGRVLLVMEYMVGGWDIRSGQYCMSSTCKLSSASAKQFRHRLRDSELIAGLIFTDENAR